MTSPWTDGIEADDASPATTKSTCPFVRPKAQPWMLKRVLPAKRFLNESCNAGIGSNMCTGPSLRAAMAEDQSPWNAPASQMIAPVGSAYSSRRVASPRSLTHASQTGPLGPVDCRSRPRPRPRKIRATQRRMRCLIGRSLLPVPFVAIAASEIVVLQIEVAPAP